jgi:hypothetical protein
MFSGMLINRLKTIEKYAEKEHTESHMKECTEHGRIRAKFQTKFSILKAH